MKTLKDKVDGLVEVCKLKLSVNLHYLRVGTSEFLLTWDKQGSSPSVDIESVILEYIKLDNQGPMKHYSTKLSNTAELKTNSLNVYINYGLRILYVGATNAFQ
jgi:hypothetical protein